MAGSTRTKTGRRTKTKATKAKAAGTTSRTKTVLLLDTDVIAYRCAAQSLDSSFEWANGAVTDVFTLDDAVARFMAAVGRLMERLEATEVVACTSDPSGRYFRHDILESYKGNRKGAPNPPLLSPLMKWVREELPNHGGFSEYTKPGLEADDILGILSTHKKLIRGRKIVVSSDKDMRQLPGIELYDLAHEDLGVLRIDPDDADEWFYTQVLTGDPVDGYKGLPRVGRVGASNAMAEARERRDEAELGDDDPEWLNHYRWQVVVEMYEEKGLTEDDAIQQARMARILRACDYDFKKKEPILWVP